MIDIFGRTVTYGGSFSSDDVVVTFGDFGSGLLAQSINWSYSQQITQLYELGSPDMYLVGGRPTGQAGLTRIIGPAAVAESFYTQYGDVCQAALNTIAFDAEMGCGGATSTTFGLTMHNVVITQLAGQVTVENYLITETLGLTFIGLEYNTASPSP